MRMDSIFFYTYPLHYIPMVYNILFKIVSEIYRPKMAEYKSSYYQSTQRIGTPPFRLVPACTNMLRGSVPNLGRGQRFAWFEACKQKFKDKIHIPS